MQRGSWKNFRHTWTYVVVLSLLAYAIGGLIFGYFACHNMYEIKPNGCIQYLGWDLAVWPIFFIIMTLFNTVGLFVYSTMVSAAMWYFFWFDKRRALKHE